MKQVDALKKNHPVIADDLDIVLGIFGGAFFGIAAICLAVRDFVKRRAQK